MRRISTNRAIETFLQKYPEYKDRIFLQAVGSVITFHGIGLFKATVSFKPYTPTARVRGWLGTCREKDRKLLQEQDKAEAGEMQDSLL